MNTRLQLSPAAPANHEHVRTGLSAKSIARAFRENLYYLRARFPAVATRNDNYMALAYTIRDRLLHRWLATAQTYLQRWWHHHYPKVAIALALVTASYYAFALGRPTRLLQVTHEYASFVALIGSLYVISGGIHIRVKGEATPAVNCLFLFIGAVLANFIGTTGASMVLIRPWMRMNKYRITGFHVVFFIFLVSNIGGCLTPIGDPPLFLGYLKGV